MVLEIELKPDSVQKIEKFINSTTYKELAENAMSFNRKLNEERKMRIPYIDGQTGVAQKHYDTQRHRRERMPGRLEGQIYSYPQKRWRKKRYQYLQYFMLPKHMRFDPVVEMHTISQVENPVATLNEDSNSNSNTSAIQSAEKPKDEWGGYYEDEYGMEDPPDEPESDSDFEYEGGRIKKSTKNKKAPKEKKEPKVKTPSTTRRRTHADSIPDSEKPFACERKFCGARYKTRPGLTYHYNHSHKDGNDNSDGYQLFEAEESNSLEGIPGRTNSLEAITGGNQPEVVCGDALDGLNAKVKFQDSYAAFVDEEKVPVRNIVSPSLSQEATQANAKGGSRNSTTRRPISNNAAPKQQNITSIPTSYKEPTTQPPNSTAPDPFEPEQIVIKQNRKVAPSGYCDFCLGDSEQNKKSLMPEELIGCAECGRSGHPTCLQFTKNMMVSVKQYPWQCIECKTCTLCGTSENDDKLLFCDDCDRGYHMYCLVPPMKDTPEGSWSCQICIESFHTKKM